MTAPNATALAPRLGGTDLALLRRCPEHRARLYALLTLVLGASAVATAWVIAATGLSVSTGEFGRFIALGLGMIALGLFCYVRHDDKRLGEAAAIVGLLTLSLVLCGLLSNAGLRLGMPLVDSALARADGLVGIHVDRLIRETARWPAIAASLHGIYYSAGPGFIALLCWNLFRRRADRAWGMAATTAIATQAVALVSIFVPARGAMVHFALGGLDGLPAGSGTYFTESFDRYYFGTETMLSLDRMNGVVAFPSFHAVLALVIAQGLPAGRWRLAGYAWVAAIIASAVPVGGHYVCDLAAGAAVWLALSALLRRVMPAQDSTKAAAPARPTDGSQPRTTTL